jgi:tetratricopeptide (TPR) repeat protein
MVHNGLGNAYKALNRVVEAMLAFRLAIALQPDAPDAYSNRGTVLLGIGQAERGLVSFDRAIVLAPREISYLYNIVQSKRLHAADRHLAALLDWSARVPTLATPAQIDLHFALGKAYADLGQPAEAMTHFHAGNRIKHGLFPYDETANRDLLDRICAFFNQDFMRSLDGYGDPTDKPILIVGMPRSGTTLLTQILASHPQVFGAGETPALGVAIRSLGQILGVPRFPEGLKALSPPILRRVSNIYLSELRSLTTTTTTTDYVVDKLLSNVFLLGLVKLMIPNVRIIHAVREPLDTCLSIYGQNFAGDQRYAHDLAALGRYYRSYQRMMEHWREVLPAGSLLDVHYEAVVDDQAGQTRRLLDHCGLPWDDACLSFHTWGGLVKTASVTQVRQPIYRTSVRRSRAFAPYLGPLIEALGTCP